MDPVGFTVSDLEILGVTLNKFRNWLLARLAAHTEEDDLTDHAIHAGEYTSACHLLDFIADLSAEYSDIEDGDTLPLRPDGRL